MAIKRVVNTDFWTDEKVEGFTPEEKYFMLFLLTNPYVKLLGIYRITKKQMSFLTGYDTETITKLINRFEKDYNLIRYIDNEIAIKNFLKHSIVKGGKPVQDCLESNMKDVKNKELINWVFKYINKDELNETISDLINIYINNNTNNINDYVYDYGYDSIVDVSYNDTTTIRNNTPTKPVKHKYGTYSNVMLTDKEYETLKQEIPNYQDYIEKVSEYVASTGKSYKNFLATIRNWYRRDNEKQPDEIIDTKEERYPKWWLKE